MTDLQAKYQKLAAEYAKVFSIIGQWAVPTVMQLIQLVSTLIWMLFCSYALRSRPSIAVKCSCCELLCGSPSIILASSLHSHLRHSVLAGWGQSFAFSQFDPGSCLCSENSTECGELAYDRLTQCSLVISQSCFRESVMEFFILIVSSSPCKFPGVINVTA
jgi:hypothetical protein